MCWLAASIGLAALLVAGMPIAAAVNLAGAVRAGDAAFLAAAVDHEALAAALRDALRREAATHHPEGLDPFLEGMAHELAGRMAAPEGMATMLHARLGIRSGARPGTAPAGPVIRDITPRGVDRWDVTFAAPGGGPARAATLTLALAGPLRWQVIGASLPR